MATRENVRPFTIEEQKRVLTVGACLTCHKQNSEIIKTSLIDYQSQLKNLSPKCILPIW